MVTRRTVYELRKARERGHVLEGLAVACQCGPDHHPDQGLAHPGRRQARADGTKLALRAGGRHAGQGGPSQARPDGLLPEYGLHDDDAYRLSDVQAQAILELRLQRLTGLEQDKIVDEYRDVMATIIDLSDILARTERVSDIIAAELNQVKPSLATRAVRKSRCLAATSISKT